MIQMIKKRQFQPFIIFSYRRKECQQHVMVVVELDFNSQEEKDVADLMLKMCHGPRPGLTRSRSRGTEIPWYLIYATAEVFYYRIFSP
ncbi:putative RNA helicase [Helianthus anomalus]